MKKFIAFAFGLSLTLTLSAQAIQPPDWVNSYSATDGTVWSDTLPGTHAACVSKKDSQGKPILIGRSHDMYDCLLSSDRKNFLGTSADQSTIIDSDSVQACKAIGGRLPSFKDYFRLGKEFKNLPNIAGRAFWTTSLYGEGWGVMNIDGDEGVNKVSVRVDYRFLTGWSVRCISP